MKKRIICTLLVLLLCVGSFGCGRGDGRVLTVAQSTINTDLYPFASDNGGDLKNMIFTTLLAFDEKGNPSVGSESSAVTESLRIFYADGEFAESEAFSEGGYTAFEFSLKNGLYFSDGSPVTADDVMFSIYASLDPVVGYIRNDVLPIAGLDNYIYQSIDATNLLKIAEDILSKGASYVPGEDDAFTENESKIYWDAFYAAGENFTANIVSYVADNYCTDDLVSSYIFDGYTGEGVKGSVALSNTYAMRLWNYGNYTYSYVPDENGIFVGVGDENGGYSYKTTLEKALESEDYVQYVANEEGDYVYDRVAAKYVPFKEGDTGKRYARVLSDKYTVLSKSALTGFRDLAGNLYTLEGEDYPTLADFFSLMCISYTTDGVIDYLRMESVEGAVEEDSFTKEAAETFASALAGSHSVESIEGINLVSDGNSQKITIYIEGNKWDRIYHLAFPVVSRNHYTKGFDGDTSAVSAFGVPLSDENFANHLKERSEDPMGAGPFVLADMDKDGKFAVLHKNKHFTAVPAEYISEAGFDSVKFIATEKTALQVMEEGIADVCLIPVSEGDIPLLPENVKTYFTPSFSYDYAVVNPAVYININTRRALFSLMDTSIATGAEESKRISSNMPSFMWASGSENANSLYDESTESAKAYFAAAGYTFDENGELIDPATKQKAHFVFTLLPGAKETSVEKMFLKTAELLESLGATAEIVYDANLLMSIYSDSAVGIYSLGWETDMSGSLYMRYAVGSGSDSVKANGITALSEGGQIDNFGTVAFTDGEGTVVEYNQSSVLSILETLIIKGDESIVMEEKKAAYSKALSVISELAFELPLCQRGSVYCVNTSAVDPSTLNEAPTVFSSLLGTPWKITPASEISQ